MEVRLDGERGLRGAMGERWGLGKGEELRVLGCGYGVTEPGPVLPALAVLTPRWVGG